MGRANPAILIGFILGTLVVLGGAGVAAGGFLIGKHEGDTLHLMQIVLRMADGQLPHLDFMTPIGALAFAPMALLVDQGMGIGHAILWSQVLVGAVLAPLAFWVGYTRLNTPLAVLFGVVIMVLSVALVHGEAQRSVSISMHYNRWAWAASFIAIALALLPAQRAPRPGVDGAIIGAMMAALLMIKVTYFAAFILPVIIALIQRRNFTALAVAAATGVLIMAAITGYAGVDYWLAYLRDLLTVAGSEGRAKPGDSFGSVMAAPAYLGGSLAAILGVIFLRQSREEVGGLVLLLLVPGFFYVTYQNFGNDPQWLILLALLLFAFRPAPETRNGWGWDMRHAVTMTAVAAMAFAAPSLFNLAYSPFRHLNLDQEEYAPLLAHDPVHADILTGKKRVARADARMAMDGPGRMLAPLREQAGREDPVVFRGETLDDCETISGMLGQIQLIVDDMSAAGLTAGKRLFAADLFSSHWLFGDLEPLIGGAPWYYGGLSGFDSADYLLVPLCPVSPGVRKQILEAVTEAGTPLEELRRTELYILYGKAG